MTPTPIPTPLNPSQTVERIREIIVGRHLERLEQRVALLESSPASPSGQPPAQWEDRLCTSEARLEALQESVKRLADNSRESAHTQTLIQQQEIQRLSAQIQQIAAAKAAAPPVDAREIEQKVGTWLGQWQSSLQKHLGEREETLTRKIHEDVAGIWESTETQITRLEARVLDQAAIEERFRRIADAARALADSASPQPSETARP